MRKQIHGRWLELKQGDITQEQVDAIVNAANSHLAGGGGVDGAIHRRGGPAIIAETKAKYPDGCPTGSAVISGAGKLPARFVIHAVGPRWSDKPRDADLLRGAYRKSLVLAKEHGCQSIAFPAISTGAYGYPIEEAARVALAACAEFLADAGSVQIVRFVLFTQDAYEAFAEALAAVKGD